MLPKVALLFHDFVMNLNLMLMNTSYRDPF